jgi:tetrahydromethanopterin S-methyltransferase subunit E
MDLANLLIALLVICIVVAVAWYLINSLLPEPIRKYALAIMLVLVVIILLGYLTGNVHVGSLRIR